MPASGNQPPRLDETIDAEPYEPPRRRRIWLPVAALVLIPIGVGLLLLGAKVQAYASSITSHSPTPDYWWDARLALLGSGCGLAAAISASIALVGVRGSRSGPLKFAMVGALAAGLLMGLAVFVAGAYGASSRDDNPGAPIASCRGNLRQIGLECHLYAGEHAGTFPARLEGVVENRNALRCPRLPGLWEAAGWAAPASRGYTYVSGLRPTDSGDCVLAFDRHDGEGGNVLFLDGRIEWCREDELSVLIDGTRETVRKRGGVIRLLGE